MTQPTPSSVDAMREADAEVERILSLSDEQVVAEASAEDIAWTLRFRARLIAVKHALPGRYDGASTHAALRGDVDDAPYMQAIRAAFSTLPSDGVTIPADHIADAGKMVAARLHDEIGREAKDWRHNAYTRVMLAQWHDRLAAAPKAPPVAQAEGVIDAARFLLDRLVDHEVRMTAEEDAREWHGHVTPAMARLRAALSATTEQGEGE